MMHRAALGFSAEIAIGALRQIAAARRAWQNRLKVVTSRERSTRSTFYFLTPDHQQPSGGIRAIYRHVDILNSAGINAFVLHQRRGFRCTWFENQTPIKYAGDTTVLLGDILVIPEICVDILDRLPVGTRYIIFNQGVHLTWKGTTHRVAKHYTPGGGLVGVITVSEHSKEMLRYAFEKLNVYRVHLGVDSGIFRMIEGPRPNRIAYMPRRRSEDAHQVLELMRGRGHLDGWEIVPLDALPQAKVAAALQTTKIFLAFAYQEGFGLPPAEAMACGNFVIGYHGFGGRELFRPEFSTCVETGNVVGFARAVEYTIAQENAQPGWCEERGARASRFIYSEYSLVREHEEVTRIYADFLESLEPAEGDVGCPSAGP